jgi:hypothetical protein
MYVLKKNIQRITTTIIFIIYILLLLPYKNYFFSLKNSFIVD